MSESPTIYTERGNVEVSELELALYRALATERTRVFTKEELCRALGVSARKLDATAATLRHKIRTATGLWLVANVWGVGFRLQP